MNREDYIELVELNNAELKKENRELRNKLNDNYIEEFKVKLTKDQINWILINYFKEDEILTKNEINELVNDLVKSAISDIKELNESFENDLYVLKERY